MLEVKALKTGDVIQNKGSGEGYIVVYPPSGNSPAVAVKTLTVCNPLEWDLVARVETLNTHDTDNLEPKS